MLSGRSSFRIIIIALGLTAGLVFPPPARAERGSVLFSPTTAANNARTDTKDAQGRHDAVFLNHGEVTPEGVGAALEPYQDLHPTFTAEHPPVLQVYLGSDVNWEQKKKEIDTAAAGIQRVTGVAPVLEPHFVSLRRGESEKAATRGFFAKIGNRFKAARTAIADAQATLQLEKQYGAPGKKLFWDHPSGQHAMGAALGGVKALYGGGHRAATGGGPISALVDAFIEGGWTYTQDPLTRGIANHQIKPLALPQKAPDWLKRTVEAANALGSKAFTHAPGWAQRLLDAYNHNPNAKALKALVALYGFFAITRPLTVNTLEHWWSPKKFPPMGWSEFAKYAIFGGIDASAFVMGERSMEARAQMGHMTRARKEKILRGAGLLEQSGLLFSAIPKAEAQALAGGSLLTAWSFFGYHAVKARKERPRTDIFALVDKGVLEKNPKDLYSLAPFLEEPYHVPGKPHAETVSYLGGLRKAGEKRQTPVVEPEKLERALASGPVEKPSSEQRASERVAYFEPRLRADVSRRGGTPLGPCSGLSDLSR